MTFSRKSTPWKEVEYPMALPQTEVFTRIPNELLEAILATDFTKRQQKIILMIIRLSYGCGKGYALLRPSDFIVAGVHRNNIKKELEQLTVAGVITVEGRQIAMNKNYHGWQISPIDSGNRFREILYRNLVQIRESLKAARVINKTISSGKANQTGAGEVTGANETRTAKLTKQELESYQNINPKVDKTLAGDTPEPYGPKGSRGAERNIKKHKEKLKKDPPPEHSGHDPDFLSFWDVYPKQLDKPKAYRSWQTRLKEGVAARDLVAAAANYAIYCCKHDTLERYIKYPANFLGQDMPFRDWVNRGEGDEGNAAREAREKKKEFIRSLYLV